MRVGARTVDDLGWDYFSVGDVADAVCRILLAAERPRLRVYVWAGGQVGAGGRGWRTAGASGAGKWWATDCCRPSSIPCQSNDHGQRRIWTAGNQCGGASGRQQREVDGAAEQSK